MNNDMDSDLTQIYPMPGGNREDIQNQLKNEQQQQKFDVSQSKIPINEKVSRTLIDAASPLLVLVAQVSNTLEARDTHALRMGVREEINAFIEKTQRLGVAGQARQDATYILCVAVDEAVLNTPWGRQSDWRGNTLLKAYFQDAEEDSYFFEKLKELGSDPVRNNQLLKLIYYVLSLGYQGRYRDGDNAAQKVAKIQQWVAERVLNAEGNAMVTATLSSHWKGISGLGFGLKSYVSGWLVSGLAALLLAGIFTYFFSQLQISTDAVNSQLDQLDVPMVERIR